MHLAAPSLLPVGQPGEDRPADRHRRRHRQRLGLPPALRDLVGAPGWYEGGQPSSTRTPSLKAWDKYS